MYFLKKFHIPRYITPIVITLNHDIFQYSNNNISIVMEVTSDIYLLETVFLCLLKIIKIFVLGKKVTLAAIIKNGTASLVFLILLVKMY